MKKKWFVVLLAAVLILSTGCGKAELADLDTVEVEMTEETILLDEANQIAVVQQYPVVSAATEDKKAEAVIQALNAQLQQDAENFVKQVSDAYLADAQPGVQFVYQAEVVYNTKGMLSVVQRENFAGQTYLQYAATYRLGDGEKMTLGEVLGKSEKEAAKLVAQQLGGVAQSDPATFHADAQAYIDSHMEELQYYRCAEGLDVFFQAGTTAPASVGVIEIVIQ